MTKTSLLWSCCAVLLLAVACGGNTGDQKSPDAGTGDTRRTPAIASFTASSTRMPHSGGDVTLTWQVSDATEVSIDNGIGRVSGTSTVAHVTASTTYTLTATSAAGSATATASVTVPSTIAVSGKVVDVFGTPIANASVLVLGGTPTSSDNSGTFNIPAVTTPYDIVVVSSGSQLATVYKGLSRENITLTLIGSAANGHAATLKGTVTGGETPFSVDTNYPLVLFASPETRAGADTWMYGSYSPYSSSVSWSGPAVTTGSLYALQPVRSSTNAVPSRYAGFARRDNVSLSDGSTVSGQDITLSSVANSTLAGTITAPGGYSIAEKGALLVVQPNAALQLFYDQTPSSTFSYAVPAVPQTSLTLYATATRGDATSSGSRTGLAPGSNSVALALQEAPHLNLPVDQAANVARTLNFAWTAYSGGVHLLEVSKVSPEQPPYDVYLVTSATLTTLPDLSAIGMGLPGNASFEWRVEGMAPFSSVDDAVNGLKLGKLLTLQTDGTLSDSGPRSFSTAAAP